jgi:lipopolysaccharide/colanic/teichoic acid biosynthesis glycosyltransferase
MASRARRVTDAILASTVLVLFAPLCLVIATAILLEGGGGVVFTQIRVGRGGRRFRILKFRTMRPAGGGRPGDVPLRQRRDDPRCTHVGRLLRRFHLDELPQLVNVLAGDMTLIGPRPLIPEEDAIVSEAWAGRHDVMPGITGEWQVRRCAQTDVAELIRFDRGYLSARSLRRDLNVLARTVACVARGAGR